MSKTIFELLNVGNESAPAIIAPEGPSLTYQTLRMEVERLAGQLRALGIARNDRVAIVLPDGPEMAVVFLAVASCATAAPLNPAYQPHEFEFYLDDLEARALITRLGDGDNAHEAAPAGTLSIVLEGTPGELSFSSQEENQSSSAIDFALPDDVALMLHTSGTTSRPKLVPLTHLNLVRSAMNIAKSLELTANDRCLNVMPLFHIHGIVAAILSSLAAGASVSCTSGFDAFKFFSWMDALKPTWYTAVPTMHQLILQRANGRSEVIKRNPLRFLRSSSAALPVTVMEQLETAFGAPVVEAYGMTEASHQMSCNPLPPGVRKPGSVGRGTGVDVSVIGDDGTILPTGELGEVAILGGSVTGGYDKNPEANSEAFINGWFRTGDQGYLDEGGYLFLTGRLKEIINRGGEKVSPSEVDDVLLRHESVEQVVTFAVPHPKLGEEVAAAVVLNSHELVVESDLSEHVARYLAAFKVPRTIVFVDEIPKGPTGKIQRIGMAERLGLGS